MSTVVTAPPASAPAPARRKKASAPARVALWAGLGLVIFSAVRVVTGADDITSAGTIGAALGLAVPIGMAGLGGLWSERAGVVNIGLEGQLILGTWGAGWAGYQWGPWAGVLAAVVLGGLGGLLHAVATVSFGVDHIVSGVAINILGLGVTQFLSSVAFDGVKGGGPTQSPRVSPMTTLSVPGLGAPLKSLEGKHWFLVSDAAGVARGLLTNVSSLTAIAVLLIPLTYVILWRTTFGLRLRSCGEDPWAAQTLGVKVRTMKYSAVVISGALAGLGGAFLTIVAAGVYREGQTGGRGFIGLAAMIFGNWRPGGLALGAGLFGYTDALQLRRGGESVHALLLLVTVLLLALAVWHLTRGRTLPGISAALGAAVFGLVFAATDEVAGELTGMLPYVTTLLVLSLASQRLRMPAADGAIYRPGEGR